MEAIQISGLALRPVIGEIVGWLETDKLDEDELDRRLGATARSLLEVPVDPADWLPLDEVESLVELLADRLGGEADLSEWAAQNADALARHDALHPILLSAQSLVDGAGYVVSQAGERILRPAVWRYAGGRERFEVQLLELGSARAATRTWIGALLARLVELAALGFSEVSAHEDSNERLVISGELSAPSDEVGGEAERLHRAALS